MAESFTCPRCGMTSYHPSDVEYGYCGNCHQFTGLRALEDAHAQITAVERRLRPHDWVMAAATILAVALNVWVFARVSVDALSALNLAAAALTAAVGWKLMWAILRRRRTYRDLTALVRAARRPR